MFISLRILLSYCKKSSFLVGNHANHQSLIAFSIEPKKHQESSENPLKSVQIIKGLG